jgi:hypothetical protein
MQWCCDVVFNNAYWRLRVHWCHQPWNGCIEYSVALRPLKLHDFVFKFFLNSGRGTPSRTPRISNEHTHNSIYNFQTFSISASLVPVKRCNIINMGKVKPWVGAQRGGVILRMLRTWFPRRCFGVKLLDPQATEHGCSKMQWPTTNQPFDHHDRARPAMHYYLISMIDTRTLGPVAKVRSVK